MEAEKAFSFWQAKEKRQLEDADGARSARRQLQSRRSPKPTPLPRPSFARKPALDDSVVLSPSQVERSRGGTVVEVVSKLDRMLTPPPTLTRTSISSLPEGEDLAKHVSGLLQREEGQRKEKPDSNKARRSGFTNCLDGPETRPLKKTQSLSCTQVVTPSWKASRTDHPVLSKSLSDSLKYRTGPEREYLIRSDSHSEELNTFWEMVHRIGQQFCPKATECLESPVISESLSQRCVASTGKRRGTISLTNRGMVTVAIETSGDVPPTVFNCDVDGTVEDTLRKALNRIDGKRYSAHKYLLKVSGKDEYLDSSRLLSDYDYVYQCLKFSSEVKLVLLDKDTYNSSFPRKSHRRVATPPTSTASGVTREELNTLLNSYFSKDAHFRLSLSSADSVHSPVLVPTLAQSIIICVQLLCERLAFIEPPEVTEAVFNLRRACKAVTPLDLETSIVSMEGAQAEGEWVQVDSGVEGQESTKDILSALDVLQTSVWLLVSIYCASFLPGFCPQCGPETGTGSVSMSNTLRVKVSALHRLPQTDFHSYDMFQVEACVYYGGKSLSKRVYSPPAKTTRSFFPTVVWDKWLNLGIELSRLPREARICFTLHGLTMPGSSHQWTRTPLAWVALKLFTPSGWLVGGVHLLGLWISMGEAANPLDSTYSSLHSRSSPVIQVAFEGEKFWRFPHVEEPSSKAIISGEAKMSVIHTLKTIAQRDSFSSLSKEEQRLLWDNRSWCASHVGIYPRGLPALLLSTPHWHSDALAEVWGLLQSWPYSDPIFGLELLNPQFADCRVRTKAVKWISQLRDDDLLDFLPQLVQSLRYDCYIHSSMAELLLSRAATSPRVAHYLFWHLRLLTNEVRYSQHYSQLLSALQSLCGVVLRAELARQVELVEQLCAIATDVKGTRDGHRQTALVQRLKQLSQMHIGCFRLPLDPALYVCGIDVEACSFFNSNTVPLRLVFSNADPFGSPVQLIYKLGDDLRQDALILQMLKLMEKIWLRAGLDLKILTYRCLPTGPEEGMLEYVSGAETLRVIQTQHGLAGSFKDKPLSEWLRRHNPTDSQYAQAVENFTVSCAGYCVATYTLGICDRHNDNIMVKKSGHMFHIDFSRILGNAQMFGSIRRDRVPFVLTPDMAYVINDGDSSRFRRFVELCCAAYNELRRHSSLFISILSLMLASNLPQLASSDDVQYVRDALMVGRTDNEATYAFTKHIEASLGSLATQINFFIHNIAQWKFSSSGGSMGLLSFSPNSHSIATDGKIQDVKVVAYHKRFYPESFYVYEIEVDRFNITRSTTTIFRRYREFDELNAKLSQLFPSEPLPQLPGKIYVPGKSHTKQTSEKRQVELNRYLQSLLCMHPRVSECDVVYTFLHCLPRDEQDTQRMEEEDIGSHLQTSGKIKVRLWYQEEEGKLSVAVEHVRGLLSREGAESADPYVKLYLLPHLDKSTKRKTKVVRKTLNPTYSETFVYTQFSRADVLAKTLQLSVWDASTLLSNQCLAVACVEMLGLADSLCAGVERTFVLQRPLSL